MSSAQQAAAPEANEAPWGFTIDRETGERRPKKTRGRVRKPPSVDEIKESLGRLDDVSRETSSAEDRPPKSHHRRKDRPPGVSEPVPQHRPGVITKGVNKLYRKAGKIVKAMDRDIGIAIIESTHNTDEDGGDDSVGAAWDEVARSNPRIRAFLLKTIAGGAWTQLVMAHAPIVLAILMKERISKHIPFAKFLSAMAEPDEDGAAPGGLGGLLSGMNPDDMAQMMAMAQNLMGQTAAKAA